MGNPRLAFVAVAGGGASAPCVAFEEHRVWGVQEAPVAVPDEVVVVAGAAEAAVEAAAAVVVAVVEAAAAVMAREGIQTLTGGEWIVGLPPTVLPQST